MSHSELEEKGSNAALIPLLRWAEPIFAPARERTLQRWAAAARSHPEQFDLERLRHSIDAAFAEPALGWSSRTLLLELAIARHQQSLQGDTPQQRFQDFLDWIDSAPGRHALDTRYPLLQADIARQAVQAEQFLDTFLQRITDDLPRMAMLFPSANGPGRLRAFAMGQGDRHDHGGSVVKLAFEGGRALYKPRSLAMDAAYARLVAALVEHGVEPTQQAATTLGRGDYGYAAWVEHAPLADDAAAMRYYQRYGGLVALSYALNCTDLHLENLIACGEYPVLIDLETVLQPWISRDGKNDDGSLPYAPSILVSGLLPGQLSNLDARDISGLAWAEHRYKTRLVAGAGTDELRLAPADAVAHPGPNVPYLADGQRVASHGFVDAIVNGFEATYRGLHRLKSRLRGMDGLLAPFARLETRTVLRSTQIYARLLNAISHPQYLRSAAERESVLARLELGGREWSFLLRAQPVEREAMLRGDVPRFLARVDGVDINDCDGHVITKLCERSGWAEVQQRLRGLSPRDLRRQRYALVQTLECDRMSSADDSDDAKPPLAEGVALSLRPYRGGSFLATAIALGDELLQLSFRDRHGIVFFQPEYRDSKKSSMQAMGVTLYEGLSGPLLLFAELGLQSGLTRFTRAAEVALRSCRRLMHDDALELTSVGPYDGMSGWIYALLTLGVRWRRDDLIDEAASWLLRLRKLIDEDQELDLIAGAAGCLLVLLELHKHRPSHELLAAAAACVARLAATAQRDADGAYWRVPASQGRGLTGYAHGNAGIGAALLRYGQRMGDAASQTLAAEALRYERVAFERRGRRWYDRYEIDLPDGQSDDVYSWCHGAPGVGLARLLWPASARDAAWHDELAHCVAMTRAHGMISGHCLCHGQFGNVDLLLEHAMYTGDAVELAEARRLGQAALDGARSGWLCGGGSVAQQPLGMMVGLAGIAYGCLRLADPVGTPSVLSLSIGRFVPVKAELVLVRATANHFEPAPM